MASPEKTRAFRMMMTQVFLDQLKPVCLGMPEVWARQFGEAVSTAEGLGRVAKVSLIPFAKSKFRTDFRIYHKFSTKLGEAIAVQHFSGTTVQPVDYIFILNRNIPHSAVYAKAKKIMDDDQWVSSITEKGEEDQFITFLNNIERKTKFLPDKPEYHVNWTYHLGKIAVNVPYTLSLMPLGEGKTLFLIKLNYKPGLIKVSQTKFRVDEAFMLAEWIDEALGQFNFEGDPTPLDVPIPALSLLAIPKIAELFDYQGEEIEWPADISGFSPSDPISTPKPKGDPLPKADPVQEPHKFCTACGEKLKSEAAFCSKCGTKQD